MRPLSVYVHIPFCTIKCGYCDFNAYAGMDSLKASYGRALVAEAHAHGPLLRDREIASIGFGGGTPGEVPASDIGAVLEALREHAELADGAEVTLEANPGTIDLAGLRDLRRAGVTRISFGAQSFHTAELRFLDRIHSPEANVAAVGLAREAGFERISLDLIYALPGQTIEAWTESVDAALALDPGHISAYALTVEEGTPLGRRVEAGEVTMPDGDEAAALYEAGSERLEAAGYAQYEVSNWARPGHESRHNQIYWTDGEYLALGAGAHGYLAGERYENIAHPRSYITAVEGGGGAVRPALASSYVPDERTAMGDWISLRLRRMAGFEPSEFTEKFGAAAEMAVGPVLAECAAAGVLAMQPRVRLTKSGRLLHGEVSARLVAALAERP